MNTYQVLIILIVDTRILCCVADSLQESGFSSISPTDNKDTKASIFSSEVIGIAVAHDRRGYGLSIQRDCVGTPPCLNSAGTGPSPGLRPALAKRGLTDFLRAQLVFNVLFLLISVFFLFGARRLSFVVLNLRLSNTTTKSCTPNHNIAISFRGILKSRILLFEM